MNRIQLIIILSITALLVLVLLVFVLTRIIYQNNTAQLSTSSTTSEDYEPGIVESLNPNKFIEDDLDLGLPESAAISNAEITLLEEGLPDSYVYVQPDPKDTQQIKYYADSQLTAEIVQKKLVVKDSPTGKIIAEFNLEDNTSESAFVWLKNNLLLLVEKENTSLQIDTIYLLNTVDKSKLFLLGSFPAATRFNISIDPARYDNSEKIVFTDNDEQLWQMELSYKFQ